MANTSKSISIKIDFGCFIHKVLIVNVKGPLSDNFLKPKYSNFQGC